jgi:hypothetical protein
LLYSPRKELNKEALETLAYRWNASDELPGETLEKRSDVVVWEPWAGEFVEKSQ